MAPLPIDDGSTGLCWPTEWFQEDLPLEDPYGQTLDRRVEEMCNELRCVPNAFENFATAPRDPSGMHAGTPEAPQKENVLVFADSGGLCGRILENAPEGRVGSRRIVEDCSRLAQDDVATLINSLRDGWDLVIFGYGLESLKSNSTTHLIEQQDMCARLLFWLLQEMQQSDARLAVITRGVFTEDPSQHRRYGLHLLGGAPLFGMSNSARLEMDIRIQYIDTEWLLSPQGGCIDPHHVLPRLASEVFRQQTFGHNSVRVLSSGRYVLRRVASREYEAANQEVDLPTSGTIVITGGTSALGLEVGKYLLELAEQRGFAGFSLCFLSRRGITNESHEGLVEAWHTVQRRAQKLGVVVESVKCDLTKVQAVDKVFEDLKGCVTGLIHAASAVRDAMLSNLTWERFEQVFDPKHRAALHIHSALERYGNSDLKFCWFFSSIAVFGQLGQINYSATSSCLDALARYRKARGRPCLSIQWGSWGEVGMGATMPEAMRKRLDAGPEPCFSNREAFMGLEAGLRTGLPTFSVLKFNWTVLQVSAKGADTALQCFVRNFHSEILSLPMTTHLEPQHVYTVFRELHGPYSEAPEKQRLVHSAYTQQFIEEDEKEWGDDFRKWAK